MKDPILKNYNILCFCDSVICRCYMHSNTRKTIGEENLLYLENYCYNKKIRLNNKIIRIFLEYSKNIYWIEKFDLNARYYFKNYMSDVSDKTIYLFIRKYFSDDTEMIILALCRLDNSKKYREKIYKLIDDKLDFLKKYIQVKRYDTIMEELISLIDTKTDISEFDYYLRKIFMDKNIKCVILESADVFYLMYLRLIPFNFQIFLEGLKKENIDIRTYELFILKNCLLEDIYYFLDYKFSGLDFYNFLSTLEEKFPYKYLEISTQLIINFLEYNNDYLQMKYSFLKLKNLIDTEKIYNELLKREKEYILREIFDEKNYNIKIRYLIGKKLDLKFPLDFLHEIIKDNNIHSLKDLFYRYKRSDLQRLMINKLKEIYN